MTRDYSFNTKRDLHTGCIQKHVWQSLWPRKLLLSLPHPRESVGDEMVDEDDVAVTGKKDGNIL